MQITAGNVIINLKSWNYQALGSYNLRQEEAKAVIDAIEREKPKVVKEINKGDYYHIECPSCGKTLNQTDTYCSGCGQKLAKKAKKRQDQS